jgi:RNA polymerase sigma-70 factor (ECF subfamily)
MEEGSPTIEQPPPPRANERDIEAARHGSREALGQLLETCRQYLLLVANQELDADLRGKLGPSDLVQDTFLEAQRAFGHFQGRTEAELLTWLRRILLRNVADAVRNYRRAAKRQVSREVALEAAPVRELRDAIATEAHSPRAQLVARERDEALDRALGQLPEPARQVIRWRNYERCSFEEIGRRLGRSAEAARKVWVRALQQLHEILEPPDGSR